jgi:hypothetical protein
MEDLIIYENLINEKALVIFEEISINVLSKFLVLILLLLFTNAALSFFKNI